jgi:hypothetical protein
MPDSRLELVVDNDAHDTVAKSPHDNGAQSPLTWHKTSTTASSLKMKQDIERRLKITFTDLFEWGEDQTGKIMLDRRVCLLFHPEDHVEYLDSITRWLLMHHVEVSSPWFEGCWEYFTQQIDKGGSGIIIVRQCP